MRFLTNKTSAPNLLSIAFMAAALCFITLHSAAKSKKANIARPYYEWKVKGDTKALVRKQKGQKDVVLTPFKYYVNAKASKDAKKYVQKTMSYTLDNGKEAFLIYVKTQNGYGIINNDGHEILGCSYSDISLFYSQDNKGNYDQRLAIMAVKGKNGKWGVANVSISDKGICTVTTHDGKAIDNSKCVYDKVEKITNLYVIKGVFGQSQTDTDNTMVLLYQNGKCGLYVDGHPLTPCIYDVSSAVFKDAATNATYKGNAKRIVTCIKGDKWTDNTYVMKRGDNLCFISDTKPVDVKSIGFNGQSIPNFNLSLKGNRYYVSWTSHNEKCDDGVTYPAVQTWDITNKTVFNGEVLDNNFSQIKSDADNVVMLKWKNLWNLYDISSGKVLLSQYYKNINTFNDASGFISLTDNKSTCVGYMTRGNHSIVTLDNPSQLPSVAQKVKSVGPFDILKHTGGFGLFCHETGKILACNLDTVYEAGKSFPGLFVIRRNNFMGLADRKGVVALPVYTSIEPKGDSVTAVCRGWGLAYETYLRKSKDLVYRVTGSNSQTLLHGQIDMTDITKETDLHSDIYRMAVWVGDKQLEGLSYYVHGMKLENEGYYESAISSYNEAIKIGVPCERELHSAQTKHNSGQAELKRQKTLKDQQAQEEEQRRLKEYFAAQHESEMQRQKMRHEKLQQISGAFQQTANTLQQLGQSMQQPKNNSRNVTTRQRQTGDNLPSSTEQKRKTNRTRPQTSTTTPFNYYAQPQSKCHLCHGSTKCVWCKGRGKVNTVVCDNCHGTGICARCHGTGKQK